MAIDKIVAEYRIELDGLRKDFDVLSQEINLSADLCYLLTAEIANVSGSGNQDNLSMPIMSIVCLFNMIAHPHNSALPCQIFIPSFTTLSIVPWH